MCSRRRAKICRVANPLATARWRWSHHNTIVWFLSRHHCRNACAAANRICANASSRWRPVSTATATGWRDVNPTWTSNCASRSSVNVLDADPTERQADGRTDRIQPQDPHFPPPGLRLSLFSSLAAHLSNIRPFPIISLGWSIDLLSMSGAASVEICIRSNRNTLPLETSIVNPYTRVRWEIVCGENRNRNEFQHGIFLFLIFWFTACRSFPVRPHLRHLDAQCSSLISKEKSNQI